MASAERPAASLSADDRFDQGFDPDGSNAYGSTARPAVDIPETSETANSREGGAFK